jgi:hypothetical protein
MYVCISVYVRTYIHTYIHICIYKFLYIHIYVYITYRYRSGYRYKDTCRYESIHPSICRSIGRTCAHGLRKDVHAAAEWVGVEVEASARCEPAAAARDRCRRRKLEKRSRRQRRRSRACRGGRHPEGLRGAVFGADSAESDCAGCVEHGSCRKRRDCTPLPSSLRMGGQGSCPRSDAR